MREGNSFSFSQGLARKWRKPPIIVCHAQTLSARRAEQGKHKAIHQQELYFLASYYFGLIMKTLPDRPQWDVASEYSYIAVSVLQYTWQTDTDKAKRALHRNSLSSTFFSLSPFHYSPSYSDIDDGDDDDDVGP